VHKFVQDCVARSTTASHFWIVRQWPMRVIYSSILAHKNWQIKTAVWNLTGFLHCSWARGKRRGFSHGTAVRHSQYARIYTDYLTNTPIIFTFMRPKKIVFPNISQPRPVSGKRSTSADWSQNAKTWKKKGKFGGELKFDISRLKSTFDKKSTVEKRHLTSTRNLLASIWAVSSWTS